jgi:hypothetical protein
MAQRKTPAPVSEAVTDVKAPPITGEDDDLAPEEFRRRVAETAYFLAAARDFANGDPVQDWLEAEIMVHAAIAEDRKA